MTLHAVIMAGGRGTRFWPWSRRSRPKQLLPIVGDQAMLAATVARLEPLIPMDRILIATSQDLADQVREVIPNLPRENLILEPAARDTAACVGLATLTVLRRDPKAVLALLPADHSIQQEDRFRDLLEAARQEAAATEAIVTLGIPPTRPEMGYGYLQRGPSVGQRDGQTIYQVERFTEKPDEPTARRYIEDGRYLWNGGMFVFRGPVMRQAMERLMPELARGLDRIDASWEHPDRQDVIRTVFPGLPAISLDYGIMESYRPVHALEARMGWSDVGSFDEVAALTPATENTNLGNGEMIAVGSRDNLVIGRRTIALVGCEDLIVVDTEDALLICRRGRSQGVKDVVKELERSERDALL